MKETKIIEALRDNLFISSDILIFHVVIMYYFKLLIAAEKPELILKYFL